MKMHYYDFASEFQLKNWKETGRTGDLVDLKCDFEWKEGNFLLLWNKNLYSERFDIVVKELNGENADEVENDFYISESGVRLSREIHTVQGRNTVHCRIALPPSKNVSNFSMQILPLMEKIGKTPVYVKQYAIGKPEHFTPVAAPSFEGMTPGMGHELAPGRFGMKKGDGLLDCAMSRFGKIDKMFLCGHPSWDKPYPWSYSLLQSEEEWHAEDEVKVDALHVEWKRKNTRFLYSIASPGIVTENNSGKIRISKLEFTGSYRYVMTAGETASLNSFSGEYPENWVLLFGSNHFPDVPLLVLLDRKPEKTEFKYLPTSQLTEIIFHGVSRITTATPFGFDMMKATAPDDDTFRKDALSRCRFWSRALLAVPVVCKEYYSIDRTAKKVRIVQRFEYKMYQDEWNTEPLKIAPLPPVLALSGQEQPENAIDFRFPTKFGPFKGYISDGCEYSVAMMETRRKFPLNDKGSGISEVLSDGLQEFMDFEKKFPDTLQSYAYPGAILESYAYSCSIFNFLPEKARKVFQQELKKRLACACDPNRKYTLLKIDRPELERRLAQIPQDLPEDERDAVERKVVCDYFMSPDMPRMEMFNLYERREKYTGRKYYLCYFNCGLFVSKHLTGGTREEIMNYPGVCIENDWGIGLTMYMIYLSALVSGDYSEIRKHWNDLLKIYLFFEVYHDWACMTSGYAEKSRTWIEGAGYGAFPAIINLADAIGDKETADRYTYLAAKMLALCEARFLASTYFAKQYHVEPWYGNRFFQEEYYAGNYFLHVPHELCSGRVQELGISMLTTDAIYPELFESFRTTIPGPHRDLISRFRNALLDGSDDHWVEFSYLLVNNALDELVPVEQTKQDIELAMRTNRFVRLWHDIDRFENNLPKNYLKSQLLAWLEMRKHPVWAEHWQGLRIEEAVWDNKKKQARITVEETEGNGLLILGFRQLPEKYSFTGKSVEMKEENNEIIFRLNGSGELTMDFSRR